MLVKSLAGVGAQEDVGDGVLEAFAGRAGGVGREEVEALIENSTSE